MLAKSHIEYSKRLLNRENEDKEEEKKTRRIIEIPWIGTAEIGVRWKTQGGNFVKTLVPENLEEKLGDPARSAASAIMPILLYLEPEGMDILPNRATSICLKQIVPYVVCGTEYLSLSETVIEVNVAETYRMQFGFGQTDHGIGVSTIILGEEVHVPPRQSISVYIRMDKIGAMSVKNAIDKIEEGETFIMGVKLIGSFKLRPEIRAWRMD